MEESATYQVIITKGALAELKKTLLRQGHKAFGEPSAEIRAAIEGTRDLAWLEELSLRLLDVKSWPELLNLPAQN